MALFSTLILTITSDHPYGDLFIALQNDEKITLGPFDYRYVCVRQYVKQNHLTNYEIEENPKKIKMFDVDCRQTIAHEMQVAADSMSDNDLSSEQKDCIKNKFKEGGYFDDMAVAVALRESSITMQQNEREKAKFIERMKEMSADLNQCVMKKKKEDKKEQK